MKLILAKARKLHGRTTVRGMQISIENAKGTTRRWYDEHGKETGSTFMHYAYGYIRGTLGTDGDHVDVYVGPKRKSATHAYIVTQMKKPSFTEVDEQKVMLGFADAKAAKKAYLAQYNDPRFFGSMKAMPIDEFKAKVLDRENHGELVKAALGEQAPTHKYKSRKADGKGGWIYEYDEPTKTTGRTGTMFVSDSRVRSFVDQALNEASILEGDHENVKLHPLAKKQYDEGRITQADRLAVETKPGKVLGSTSMVVRTVDGKSHRVFVAIVSSKDPDASGTTEMYVGEGKREIPNSIRVNVPAGLRTLGHLKAEARRVLAHELTHAQDVIHHSVKEQNAQRKVREEGSSADDYREYRNQKIEVTAKLHEIVRDLTDHAAHDDLLSSARYEADYKGTELEGDFGLEAPLAWAKKHSPQLRQAIDSKLYTPKNEKRILRAVADTYQSILDGKVKPIKKAEPVTVKRFLLLSDLAALRKADGSKPPGGGWMAIPNGHKGGFRRRKGTDWEYWYPGDGASASHEPSSEKPKPKVRAYTEADYERGDFDKNPAKWHRRKDGAAVDLDSKAPVKYAGRVAALFQIVKREPTEGYALLRDLNAHADEKPKLYRHDRLIAVEFDPNRAYSRPEKAPTWTPGGSTKGGGFDEAGGGVSGEHAPSFEQSKVSKEKSPGTWAIENGVYPMKNVLRVRRTEDGKVEREKARVIGVPDYGKQQLVAEYEGMIANAAKSAVKRFGLTGSDSIGELQRAGVEGMLNAIDAYKADLPFAAIAKQYVTNHVHAAASRERLGGVKLDYRFERNMGRFFAAQHAASKASGGTPSAEDIAEHLDMRKKHFVSKLSAEQGNQRIPMDDWHLSVRGEKKENGAKGEIHVDTRTRPGRLSIVRAYQSFLAGEASTAELTDEVAAFPTMRVGFGLDPYTQLAVREEADAAAKTLSEYVFEKGRTAFRADMHELVRMKFGLTGDTADEPSVSELAREIPIYSKTGDGKEKRISVTHAREVLPEMLADALSKLAGKSEGKTRALIEQARDVLVPTPPPVSGPTYEDRLKARAAAVSPSEVSEYRQGERKRLLKLQEAARGRLGEAKSEGDRHVHEQAVRGAEEALRHVDRMPESEIRDRLARALSPMTAEMRRMALAVQDVEPQNPDAGYRYDHAKIQMRDPRTGQTRETRVRALVPNERVSKAEAAGGTIGAADAVAFQRYPQTMKLLHSPDALAAIPSRARRVLETLTGLRGEA